MDDDIRELTDKMRELSEVQHTNASLTHINNEIMKRMAQAQGINMKGLESNFNNLGKTTVQTNENFAKVNYGLNEVYKSFYQLKDVSDTTKRAFGQLATAIFDTNKNFSKYGKSLEGFNDALSKTLLRFGPLGIAASVAVQGLSKLTSSTLKQADASLKAVDDLSDVGGAGAFTAKEVLDLGHKMGLSSDNLTVFTNATKQLGTGLQTLGGTATDGIEAFAKLTTVTKEQRMAFQRLGVSQEELMQRQADYVKLQEASGLAITKRMRQDGEVQKLSLEYAKSLTIISEITGRNAKEAAEGEKRAKARFDIQIHQNQIQREAEDLRQQAAIAEKEGNIERRDQLKKEATQLEKRLLIEDQLLNAAEQTGDAQVLAAVQSKLATDAYTETSAVLLRTNVDLDKIMSENMNLTKEQLVEQGKLGDAAADFGTQLKVGVADNIKNFGKALVFSQENASKFGVTINTIGFEAKNREVDLRKAYDEARKRVGKPEEGETGKKVAEDPAQIARNKLTEAEREATIVVDKLVEKVNPLINGFNDTTTAATALAGAATAAAIALGAIAAGKTWKGLESIIKGKAPTPPVPGGGITGGAARIGAGALATGALQVAGAGAVGYGIGSLLRQLGTNEKGTGILDTITNKVGDILTGNKVSDEKAMKTTVRPPIRPIARAPTTDSKPEETKDDKKESAKANIKFGSGSGSENSFNQLHPILKERLMGAAEEYSDMTKGSIQINSAYRDPAKQQELWDESEKAGRPGVGPNGMLIARPGKSKHEHGLAVDIQNYNDPAAVDSMNKNGLYQPFKEKDPVHFELYGARLGGEFSGPDSGYPVMLHGTEIVMPKNNIDFGNEAPSVTKKELPNAMMANTVSEVTNNRGIDTDAIITALADIVGRKLDNVVDALQSSHTTQKELLNYTRV